ncbi:MAG: RNA-directed DNA polymerase [Caldilineaceae bacterium]|nr:RNA-directed DNA polymerase [Caldilineaceae bacterium]
MSAVQEGTARRPIIELQSDEAKAFLLKHESYLNFELPPYFRFEGLLNEVAQKLKKNFSFKKHCKNSSEFDMVNYTILNNKDGRYAWRPYELIHPVLYVSLVNQMTKRDSWHQIVTRFQKFASNPKISCLSVPVQSLSPETDKAEQIKQWWEKVEQKSIELSLDFECVFHTDLVDCYAAIYTHSIAWALHTKKIAKANKNDMSLIGNVIDLHIRAMRYGQTNGIPQGSVLTDFIAEMVLGYADAKLSDMILKERIEEYQILRFRDDYRIFVNNPQDGEKILRCLTEVMIDLGLKLKPEKTRASSEVIRSSIKEDKLDWLYRKTGDRIFHKHLLIIHDQNTKYPNGGSVSRALQEFDERLEKRLEKSKKVDFPMALISVVVDIAFRSPRTYPVAAAILSKLIVLLDSEIEKRVVVEKVRKKISARPNTGHMEIWLQRFSIKFAPDIEYAEPLCGLVRQESAPIWNNSWIGLSTLKNVVDPNKIIDMEELEKVGPVIPNKEVRLFDVPYPW